MEWASGNIYIRPNTLANAGDKVNGHTHNFDHTSIFYTGSFHVKATFPNGKVVERDFVAPAHCLIKADVEHEITALEPNSVFWCVYAHRNPQGDVVQDFNGWGANYV